MSARSNSASRQCFIRDRDRYSWIRDRRIGRGLGRDLKLPKLLEAPQGDRVGDARSGGGTFITRSSDEQSVPSVSGEMDCFPSLAHGPSNVMWIKYLSCRPV
jgi:hypothetical protein